MVCGPADGPARRALVRQYRDVTRRGQFGTGFGVAVTLTLALSATLFFGSQADDAFDNGFWPILWITAGIGVVLLVPRRSRFLGVGMPVARDRPPWFRSAR